MQTTTLSTIVMRNLPEGARRFAMLGKAVCVLCTWTVGVLCLLGIARTTEASNYRTTVMKKIYMLLILSLFSYHAHAQSGSIDLSKINCTGPLSHVLLRTLCDDFRNSVQKNVDSLILTIAPEGVYLDAYTDKLHIGFEEIAKCKDMKPLNA